MFMLSASPICVYVCVVHAFCKHVCMFVCVCGACVHVQVCVCFFCFLCLLHADLPLCVCMCVGVHVQVYVCVYVCLVCVIMSSSCATWFHSSRLEFPAEFQPKAGGLWNPSLNHSTSCVPLAVACRVINCS